ncbi:MAG: PDZ domain-containing protein, partial [Candidatus Eremiobacteraeota bacterium]|nr:PDZ domain-containing protein [Candidatus Eremiobacteraeota bacterium]
RAAGYAMPPVRTQVIVGGVSPASHAALRADDVLLTVDGAAITSVETLRSVLGGVKPGAFARVAYSRAGKRSETTVATIAVGGKAKLGVFIGEVQKVPPAPVPVRFALKNVAGSSGGLMFALEIYRALRPSVAHANERIAGTGTLDSDGKVGAIAGTMQKLIAARRAGATVFLVPEQNYDEIKDQPGVRIVRIKTFDQAVRALAS